jgi:putative alpha-1,2-mannosidase
MLYLWAGRPDRVADIVTLGLEREFLASRGGLPGNDDSGAMSSWLIFQSLGIYPNAGQDIYLIGTPSFPAAEIDLGKGKLFRILARNLDGQRANRYVQSATLNGKPLETAWFRHGQIKDGGTLVLTMGPEPTKWGTTTPPPSMSDPQSPLCAAARS